MRIALIMIFWLTISGCSSSTVSTSDMVSDGDGELEGCPEGSEGCSCYGNDTCDGGLICTNDTCTELSGSDGDSDAEDDGVIITPNDGDYENDAPAPDGDQDADFDTDNLPDGDEDTTEQEVVPQCEVSIEVPIPSYYPMPTGWRLESTPPRSLGYIKIAQDEPEKLWIDWPTTPSTPYIIKNCEAGQECECMEIHTKGVEGMIALFRFMEYSDVYMSGLMPLQLFEDGMNMHMEEDKCSANNEPNPFTTNNLNTSYFERDYACMAKSYYSDESNRTDHWYKYTEMTGWFGIIVNREIDSIMGYVMCGDEWREVYIEDFEGYPFDEEYYPRCGYNTFIITENCQIVYDEPSSD